MDDLLILAAGLVENNNFKNDSFQDETKPDGKYETIVEAIKLKTSAEKGTQWFSFTLLIVDGEYINEKFYVSLFLTPKTIKATMSKIMKLITSMGYEIDLDMFASYEVLEEGLQSLVSGTTTLTKVTSTNGYVNYSFEGGE